LGVSVSREFNLNYRKIYTDQPKKSKTYLCPTNHYKEGCFGGVALESEGVEVQGESNFSTVVLRVSGETGRRQRLGTKVY